MPKIENMPKKCPACNESYGCNQKNIMNHIKAKAKSELLKSYLLDKKDIMIHAEYLKNNFKIVDVPQVLVIDKDTILTLN